LILAVSVAITAPFPTAFRFAVFSSTNKTSRPIIEFPQTGRLFSALKEGCLFLWVTSSSQ